jgi:hypothetical protein
VVWLKRVGISVGAVALAVLISFFVIGRGLSKVWGPLICKVPQQAQSFGDVIGAALGCVIGVLAVLALITMVVTVAAAVAFERLLVKPSSTLWTVLITFAVMGLAIVLLIAVSVASN